jgi:uncharacterized membrane protein YtjA (UPF0391 family)
MKPRRRVAAGMPRGAPRLLEFTRSTTNHEESAMIGWAVTFLIVALVAAVLGFTGIAGAAVNIAWILAVIGIVLAIIFMVIGRRPPV